MKKFCPFVLALSVPLLAFTFSESTSNKSRFVMSDDFSNTSVQLLDTLRKQALGTLRMVMNTQPEWVKVHAAEFLIWSGYPQGVKDEFLKEEKLFGTKSQYRIGIARVLAQVANSDSEKKRYTDKIMSAFLNPEGTDRIHAAETLAKLQISPVSQNAEITQDALMSSIRSLALYTQWSVAFAAPDSLNTTKEKMLALVSRNQIDEVSVNQAAYILRNLGQLTSKEWKVLATATLANTKPNVFLYSATWVTAPNEVLESVELKQVYGQLLKFSNSPSKGERMELCMALSIKGTKADLPVLVALLNGDEPLSSESDNADVKSAAAYAILKQVK